uniref:Cadherin domain-containing protein n=1 Tax=Magallana gigas TaxID=29159 RepID=A0A8W8LT73_MAGGI
MVISKQKEIMHADLGTVVIRALAVPRTPGASIEYSILSDNEETTEFAIDKDTGIVKLWHVIVHWTEKNKKLMITLQSTRLLSIKLQDINDEEPSFNNCPNRQEKLFPASSVLKQLKLYQAMVTGYWRETSQPLDICTKFSGPSPLVLAVCSAYPASYVLTEHSLLFAVFMFSPFKHTRVSNLITSYKTETVALQAWDWFLWTAMLTLYYLSVVLNELSRHFYPYNGSIKQ